METLFKSVLGERNDYGVKVKLKTEASIVFCFVLEMERNIRMNDILWTNMAEWLTRHVEHVWFNVLAKIEKRKLNPLVVKKIKHFVEICGRELNCGKNVTGV